LFRLEFFTSQEVDAPNSDPDQWKQVFDAWNQVDAYDQPATCHMWGSTHGEPMIWATDPGHDLFFLQAGHGTLQPQSHYQVYWNAAPTKPGANRCAICVPSTRLCPGGG